VEYAVAVLCFVTAVLAMQGYITRSLQGKMRGAADTIGQQYDRTNTVSAEVHNYQHSTDTVTSTTEVGGVTTTTINTDFSESTSDDIRETIGP